MAPTLRSCQVHKYYVLPERQLFRMLMKISCASLLLYVLPTSVPSWCVFNDHLTNITNCSQPTRHVIHGWLHDSAELTISASLWYMHVQLVHGKDVQTAVVPFIHLPMSNSIHDNTVYLSPVLHQVCNVLIIGLMALGVYFGLKADRRPESLVYFGLSPLAILTATATWMTLALPNASDKVLDQAEHFCASHTEIQTNLFLHVFCGTCAILTFIVSCLLLHIALSFNTMLQYAREQHVPRDTLCKELDGKTVQWGEETNCSCECV